jgi:hypothetical protein
LFPESVLRYGGTVRSGETVLAFRLAKALAIPERWESAQGSWLAAPEFEESSEPPYQAGRRRWFDEDSRQGLRLDQGQVRWDCKDEGKGNKHEGDSVVNFGGAYTHVVLTPSGFAEVQEDPPCASMAHSDVTYITMLDPLQGEHERTYPISRKIAPGDVERFHIMIGARVSCRLLVKFKFFIDKTSLIESEEFEIQIWNPRNSRKEYDYKDGSELQREVDNLQQRARAGRLDPWESRNAADLQHEVAEYPFGKGRRRSRY